MKLQDTKRLTLDEQDFGISHTFLQLTRMVKEYGIAHKCTILIEAKLEYFTQYINSQIESNVITSMEIEVVSNEQKCTILIEVKLECLTY